MTKEETRKLLERQIKTTPNVDIDLLLAFIEIESSFDPWAVRFEPTFKYLKDPAVYAAKTGISLDTEKNLQATSFGLCQLMGCVARELGYSDHLTKLLIPEVNLVWGVEYYRVRCKGRYNKITDQISAYNAGSARLDLKTKLYSNQIYVDKVMVAYRRYQGQDK